MRTLAIGDARSIVLFAVGSEKKIFFDFLANEFFGPRRLSVGLRMTDEVDDTQDYVSMSYVVSTTVIR